MKNFRPRYTAIAKSWGGGDEFEPANTATLASVVSFYGTMSRQFAASESECKGELVSLTDWKPRSLAAELQSKP